jgi:hypothetical protein
MSMRQHCRIRIFVYFQFSVEGCSGKRLGQDKNNAFFTATGWRMGRKWKSEWDGGGGGLIHKMRDFGRIGKVSRVIVTLSLGRILVEDY